MDVIILNDFSNLADFMILVCNKTETRHCNFSKNIVSESIQILTNWQLSKHTSTIFYYSYLLKCLAPLLSLCWTVWASFMFWFRSWSATYSVKDIRNETSYHVFSGSHSLRNLLLTVLGFFLILLFWDIKKCLSMNVFVEARWIWSHKMLETRIQQARFYLKKRQYIICAWGQ